jgi:DNA transposition AAA+ family ATPase
MTAVATVAGYGQFIGTKEHRRFVEFADSVRRRATIGLCYGSAGVGKTVSARRYSRWDAIEPVIDAHPPRHPEEAHATAALHRARTVLFTPPVGATLRQIAAEAGQLIKRADIGIEEHEQRNEPPPRMIIGRPRQVELVIVDEAERLNPLAVEHLRDRFDRERFGLILIGMPGIERRFSRYPQLFSRVGFAHRYRTLSGEELQFVLERKWRSLGLALDPDDFVDAQAMSLVAQLTGGNFRLLHRLFEQIERILKINDLSVITSDVIETARSTLVLAAP